MGLFNRFKKESNHTKNGEKSGDFNPLDMNSVIAWYKRNNPNATEKDILKFVSKLAEPDSDQEHLTADGDLPWGWYTVHAGFIKPTEKEYKRLLNKWLESRKKTPKELATALGAFVDYMVSVKKVCAKKGECFDFWRKAVLFDDDYLSKQEADLKKLKQNMQVLECDYRQKQTFEKKELPGLEKRLLKIIRENQGITQTDIYKMFPSEAKSYIQEKLYYAEKAHTIAREKSGSTYKLFIK